MNPLNYGAISFPSLGLELNPPRVFSVGPLSFHLYGLAIALGLVLAVFYACRRCREFGVKEDDLLDGVLWVTPFAILCALLRHRMCNAHPMANSLTTANTAGNRSSGAMMGLISV